MDEPDTAQSKLEYGFEASAIASSGKYSPFWLHVNTNGHISSQPFSGSIAAWVQKQPTRPAKWYDYDFAVDLAGRFDCKKQTGYFRRLYAHLRLYIFDITAGILPFTAGSAAPQLSTGGLLFSNNAQPLPRISIGINRYTAFPGLYGYLEIKGGITHGWFVDKNSLDPTTEVTNAFLHHKFAGARIGGKLPVNIAYEFHHAAQWGGKSAIYGDLGNSLKSFKNVFILNAGGNNLNDQLNAEGNHIGWQELAVNIKYKGWYADLYWQTIFEDKSAAFIGMGMNVADGLWGISIRQDHWKFINAITYEFLNTTSQSGPYHDKDGIIYGGRDTYFNNLIYRQGWTHFHRTIGSPFLSPQNNRVRTHFIGIKGDIYGYNYRLLSSYTRSWGTYAQPNKTDNTAIMLSVTKKIEKAWGMEFGLTMAADIGSQFGNSFAGMITIRKQDIIPVRLDKK